MLAWSVHEYGYYKDVLQWGDFETPKPGEGQALVRVTAGGVFFAMTLRIAGKYQVKDLLPFLPVLDVVGEVVETGPGCPFSRGQRVMGTGSCSEFALVEGEDSFAVPDGIPDRDAAGLLNTYHTAYLSLVDRACLKNGEVLLVHGAAGGVGTAALQIGKALGATVIATVGSEEKLEICRQQGADFVINHRTQDFASEVNSYTGGRGADVILDPVGGDVFDQSTKCIAWSGRLLVVGFASGRIPEIAANRMLLKNFAVTGFYLGSYRKHAPDRIQNAQQQVFDWYESKQVKPLISHVLHLADLKEALNLLESRQSSGTVVLTPNSTGKTANS